MDELKIRFYRTAIMQTKRGNSKGGIINAKPIFLLSLFGLIEQRQIENNKILFEDNFKTNYEKTYLEYDSDKAITPFYKPFYYLHTDGYWHLKWNKDIEHKCISSKYLRENIDYAYLDNALWDLLQDDNTRTILRETIINHFLKIDKNK